MRTSNKGWCTVNSRHVHVQKLVLRMEGSDRPTAAFLARRIAERLTTVGLGGELGDKAHPGANLRVKVSSSDSSQPGVLADRIATAVKKATL